MYTAHACVCALWVRVYWCANLWHAGNHTWLCSLAAQEVIDASQRVRCALHLKPEYGTIAHASLATDHNRPLPLTPPPVSGGVEKGGSGGGEGGSVEVVVEAGGVAVLDVYV